MERPKPKVQPIPRELTGEIMYLDQMRRLGEIPDSYDSLSDMAIQMYEVEADMCRAAGVRPDIMDEYDMYDERDTSELAESCKALAKEFLTMKSSESRLAFVDILTQTPADEVVEMIRQTRVGELLADDDEQLAVESDGSYYPVLDIKKRDMKLNGVGVRAWGWSTDSKIVFTTPPGERSVYSRDHLRYPSGEKTEWYELDVSFSYSSKENGTVVESIVLSIAENGNLRIGRNIWCSAYAETGYEGHGGRSLDDCTDEDVAALADSIATIVGDEPISVEQYRQKQFAEYLEKVVLPQSVTSIQSWLNNSWLTQVSYDLARTRCGKLSLAVALTRPDTAQVAHDLLVHTIEQNRARRDK